MIEIMTETSNQHRQNFDICQILRDIDCFAEGVEEVADTESVHPVVIGWVPVSEICL